MGRCNHLEHCQNPALCAQTSECQRTVAGAGRLETPVRPCAWYDSKMGAVDFGAWKPTRKPSAPDADWLPMYGAAELAAAVAAERERWVSRLGAHRGDATALHMEVAAMLDEVEREKPDA